MTKRSGINSNAGISNQFFYGKWINPLDSEAIANSKSFISKQVIKNTLTLEFISLTFLINSNPFILGILQI